MTSKNPRIVWANRPGEPISNELAPAFPIGESGDPGLDITEVRLLTTALSGLYTHIIQHLARHVALARSLDVQACEIILRESIVLVTYALADRTLRLVKALAQEKLEDLTVAAAQEYVWPETNSEFSALVEGSQNFNQFLICRLASSIFGIPTVTAPRALMGDVRNLKAVNNRNFDSPPPGIRALRKIARILSRFSGKVPALRLANIEGPLLDQGLYGFGKLRWLDPLRTPVPITRDPTLRSLLARQLANDIHPILSTDLFAAIGLDSSERSANASRTFSELLLDLIPPSRLEGIAQYSAHEIQLARLDPSALLFCAMPAADEIYWIAAARKLGIPVTGVQHGAHYGFCSQPSFVDIELAYCDRFFTWGWTQMPDNPLCAKTQAIALPSPWLSERAKGWRSISTLESHKRCDRPHDVLLMSDRIQPFPPTTTTLRMSRRDLLGQLNNSTYSIVAELARRDIRVLHKPFNYTSKDMQAEIIARLAREFPNHYHEHDKLDKGLTSQLVEKAWLIIWDEPGTGFFECLAGGIPSIVLWDRLTSWEEPYARPIFKQLEAAGLVHNSACGLATAVSNYLENPGDWLRNAQRSGAISGALDVYARTDREWTRAWGTAIKNLARTAA